MPGMVKVLFKNKRGFLSRFTRKARKLGDMRDPMSQVLSLIENSIIDGVVSDRTDVDGKPFAKLNPIYAAKKAAKYGSKPILVAEKEMLDSRHFQKRATRSEGVLEYKAPKKVMTRALTHQDPETWEGPQRKWWGLRTKIIPKIIAILGKRVRVVVRG